MHVLQNKVSKNRLHTVQQVAHDIFWTELQQTGRVYIYVIGVW